MDEKVKQKLILEAFGIELKQLDKDAALCVLIEKNKELELQNKRLNKALNELTRVS